MPIQVFLKKGGSADSIIRDFTKDVIDIIESTKCVEIAYISTDGDQGHNAIYDETFNQLLQLSPSLNIEELLANENRFSLKHCGATDLLHLFKTLRVRFLKNDIDLFPGHDDSKVNHESFKKLLKPGKEIDDLSQIGKMRDVFAINFFPLRICKD